MANKVQGPGKFCAIWRCRDLLACDRRRRFRCWRYSGCFSCQPCEVADHERLGATWPRWKLRCSLSWFPVVGPNRHQPARCVRARTGGWPSTIDESRLELSPQGRRRAGINIDAARSCCIVLDGQRGSRLQLRGGRPTSLRWVSNFMRTLALPKEVEHWSLTTLREKLVKIGCQSCPPWPVRHISIGRGCRPKKLVPENLEPD